MKTGLVFDQTRIKDVVEMKGFPRPPSASALPLPRKLGRAKS